MPNPSPQPDDRPFRAGGVIIPQRPPETVIELHDQHGNAWVRKHPAPGRHTLSLDLTEIECLQRHHEAEWRKPDITAEARQHHACEAASLDEIARQIRTGRQVEAHSALHEARFVLSSAGMDQDGKQWLPRRFAPDMISVPLLSAEVRRLADGYATAAEPMLASGDFKLWSQIKGRSDFLKGIATEIDTGTPTMPRSEQPGPGSRD